LIDGQKEFDLPDSVKGSKIVLDGRMFLASVERFTNGCFVIISESNDMKLGALQLSIKVKDQINSSTIIPPRFSTTFLTMLSEMASNLTNGIALVSIHLTQELSPKDARELLSKIRSMLAKQKS
jgi:hypothetical protein